MKANIWYSIFKEKEYSLERLHLTEFAGLKNTSTQTNGLESKFEANEVQNKEESEKEPILDTIPTGLDKDSNALISEPKITQQSLSGAESKPKDSKVQIQLPKTNEVFAEKEKENFVHNHSKDVKSRPIMAQYGIGNTHPTIPSNHMKTFNIKAPLNEVIVFN